MDIRNTPSVLDSILLQVAHKSQPQESSAPPSLPTIRKGHAQLRGQDIISLSNNAKNKGQQNRLGQNQTRLTSENIDKLENGFRRTQKFESANGQKFTRVEEFTTSENRSKRIILQQNNSGNTTVLENILDRQDDGTFRLTQRFTDESGETKTNIEFNITPDSKNIILGHAPDPTQTKNEPFQLTRGTQLDISA